VSQGLVEQLIKEQYSALIGSDEKQQQTVSGRER
jgi:hypothetical protein